jgi:predicted dehydrogenase
MSSKLRWGVLGVARIATTKVIPAMQRGVRSTVAAIASRDAARAAQAALALGIPKHYGSYDALLADPDIDIIYNPLPNHLHVPWSIRAMEAGKHVLCEKPLALSTTEIRNLIDVRNRTGRKAGEAFMVAVHPQWLRARAAIRAGDIGDLRSVVGWFSYSNRNPQNVRNVPEYGGGGLMDIGCYPIFIARYLFGQEPIRACGTLELDPEFHTDRLASAILEFPTGQSIFTCSTQLIGAQRIVAFGTHGQIEVEIPFNAPADAPTRIWINTEEVTLPICDQYTLQGDLFSEAAEGRIPVPVPIDDSLHTMAALEAIVLSSRSRRWEPVAL